MSDGDQQSLAARLREIVGRARDRLWMCGHCWQPDCTMGDQERCAFLPTDDVTDGGMPHPGIVDEHRRIMEMRRADIEELWSIANILDGGGRSE